MGDDIWEHYAKEYQAREARWEPVRSGVPYTCNECPALVEMRAERDRWKHWAEEYFYTDPDCECPLCDQVRAAIEKTVRP